MDHITVVITPENSSFQGKRTIIVNQPIVIGRQTDLSEAPSPNGLKFNSKVVSRQHARLSHQDGRFYLQDTKSSSGTFINGDRLSPQGVESRQCELHDGDVIKLGEDFSQGDVVTHQSVLMRIKLPARSDSDEQSQIEDDPYVDMAMDSEVRAEVDDEFNTIWNSLTADINSPLNRLRNAALLSNSMGTTPTQTSPRTTANVNVRNDNTVTMQGSGKSNGSQLSATLTPGAVDAYMAHAAAEQAASKPGGESTIANECATFIEGLQWEPELKETLVDLARKQDQQLLAFYRSLKGFPSQFINVASKYAKYNRGKKA